MLLFIDGFDHYTSTAQLWPYIDRSGISSGGRSGNAMYVQFTDREVGRDIPAVDSGVVGFAVKMDLLGNAQAGGSCLVSLYSDATMMLELRVSNLGVLTVTRARTTVLATSTYRVPSAAWVYLEFKFVISDTVGSVEVRANGVQVISASGIDTRNGTPTTVNRLYCANGGETYSEIQARYDDMYMLDLSGSENNDFLGDVKVETLHPAAAGAHTDFTPSAGSNYQNVDDAAPDDDTTYNSSATAAAKDTFALGDLVASGVVRGVQHDMRLRKDDAGGRTAHALLRSGGADAAGSDVVVLDTYQTVQALWEQNPATSAPWTIADVNALEAGYELVS